MQRCRQLGNGWVLCRGACSHIVGIALRDGRFCDETRIDLTEEASTCHGNNVVKHAVRMCMT